MMDIEIPKQARQNGSGGLTVSLVNSMNKTEKVIVEEDFEVPLKRDIKGSPAQVGASAGLTINLGNYESARIDCWLSVPCTADDKEIADTYEAVSEFVEGKVAAQRAAMRGMKKT